MFNNTQKDTAATFETNEVCEIANKTGAKIRSFYNTANDEVAQATNKVTDQIRSKPLQSSLIALAAGFVLAALFRR